MASGAGYTPVLFSESGVGVVVLVVWIVSSIQVIQPLQSGVDCVAELVVLVNKHSLPILTLILSTNFGLAFDVTTVGSAVSPDVHQRSNVGIVW